MLASLISLDRAIARGTQIAFALGSQNAVQETLVTHQQSTRVRRCNRMARRRTSYALHSFVSLLIWCCNQELSASVDSEFGAGEQDERDGTWSAAPSRRNKGAAGAKGKAKRARPQANTRKYARALSLPPLMSYRPRVRVFSDTHMVNQG